MILETILNHSDAEAILHKPIHKQFDVSEEHLDDHDWYVVGAMQKTKGVWEYGFRNKKDITLYSDGLEIRRFPTPIELEIIQTTYL